jgi:hypothetical protein
VQLAATSSLDQPARDRVEDEGAGRNLSAQTVISSRTSPGARYMRRPCAVTSKSAFDGTAIVQAWSSTDAAIIRFRSCRGSSSRRRAITSGRSTVTHRTRPSSTRQSCVSSPSPSATTVPPG